MSSGLSRCEATSSPCAGKHGEKRARKEERVSKDKVVVEGEPFAARLTDAYETRGGRVIAGLKAAAGTREQVGGGTCRPAGVAAGLGVDADKSKDARL